jgi:hypothetical protein
LDYIDGLLSAEEAEQVREKIATDSEWKTRYDSFLEMNTLLRSTELISPSASFVDQTMARIEAEIELESKSVSPILRYFQLTGWLWLGLTMLFLPTSIPQFFHNSATRDFGFYNYDEKQYPFAFRQQRYALGIWSVADGVCCCA